MFQSLFDSFAGFHAFWLIWAAAGLCVLAICIVVASALVNESDEPFVHAARRSDDEPEIIV
jgi:hypothetical protein